MEKAVRINGKEWSQDLQLKALNEISSSGAQEQDENDKEDTLTAEEVKKVTFLDLFKSPNLRKNTLIQYFNWFTTTFVYYGLTLNADTLIPGKYTANKLTVFSTAFRCVTFATVIWLYTKQLMAVRSQWL